MAGPIRISILANASQARREIDSAVGATSKLGKVALAAGAAFAVTKGIQFGKEIVSSASTAQQSIGATEQIFKRYSDTVIKRSNAAAQAVGLSANEYRELSNVTGAMLKNSGLPLKKVADLTDNLTTRAADLAATYGGPTKDAVAAVSSLLRGEADPIERYGISIKQADVSARLAAQGLDGLTGAAKKQAEQQARVALLMEQSRDAAGQFGRESNTLAGQQQRLGAQFENLKATLGTALLPALTAVFTVLNTQFAPAVKAIGSALSPVVDAVKGFVSQIATGQGQVGGFATTIRAQVVPVIKAIGDTFTNVVLPALIAFGSYIASNVVPIVQQIAGIFVTQVLPVLSSFATFVYGTLAPAVVEIATKIGSNLKPVLDTLFQVLSQTILPTVQKVIAKFRELQPTIEKIVTVVVKVTGKVLEFAAAILGRVLPPLLRFVGFILANVVPAIANMIAFVIRVIAGVLDFGAAVLKAADKVADFARKVGEKIGDAVAFFTGLPGRILDAVSGFGTLLVQAGKDLVGGLISGIRDTIGNVGGAIKDGLGNLTGGLLGRATTFRVAAPSFSIGTGTGGVISVDASAPTGTARIELTAFELDALSRGRRVSRDLRTYATAGGTA